MAGKSLQPLPAGRPAAGGAVYEVHGDVIPGQPDRLGRQPFLDPVARGAERGDLALRHRVRDPRPRAGRRHAAATRRRILRPARAQARRLRQRHGRDRERDRLRRRRREARTEPAGSPWRPPSTSRSPRTRTCSATGRRSAIASTRCAIARPSPAPRSSSRLFDAPIDPGLLIAAQAAGVDLSSVLSSIFVPLPNYRFTTLYPVALDFVNAVRSYGSALQSALEKSDSAALTMLQQTTPAAAPRRRQPDIRLAGPAGAEQYRRGTGRL